MSTAATARYQPLGPQGMTGASLTEEDLVKLQEIHELLNLMLRELPVMAQSTAQPYVTPMIPTAPYAFSFFQSPWGRIPFLAPPGF
jgi:hypothetical protein